MARKEREEEYEVEILDRTEIVTFPKLRTPVKTYAITYVAAGLPPATIFIPVDEWSLEEEKKQIKEDIKRRLRFKPEVYRV